MCLVQQLIAAAVCPCYQCRQDVFWTRTGNTARGGRFCDAAKSFLGGKISAFKRIAD